MLDTAVIVLRFCQYGAAAILMGSPLFLLFALPKTGLAVVEAFAWPRWLVLAGAALLLIATAAGVVFQTAVMSGSLAEGLKVDALQFVLTGMDLGRSALVRAILSLAALVLLAMGRPGRRGWVVIAGLGTAATASLAWTGHAAATESTGHVIHQVADIFHAWSAAVWIGALVGFLMLIGRRPRQFEILGVLHRALHRFSGVGTLLVGVILVSGLANSWFLVGVGNASRLLDSPYGRLLALKIAFFCGMLLLAAGNRFRHTPSLATELAATPEGVRLDALRRSIILEAILGFAILAVVAWFGTLAPPAMQMG